MEIAGIVMIVAILVIIPGWGLFCYRHPALGALLVALLLGSE